MVTQLGSAGADAAASGWSSVEAAGDSGSQGSLSAVDDVTDLLLRLAGTKAQMPLLLGARVQHYCVWGCCGFYVGCGQQDWRSSQARPGCCWGSE